MSDLTMPCEDCEQGQSSCCRLVYARDIEAVIPNQCLVFPVETGPMIIQCTSLIGGTLGDIIEGGAQTEWTEEMCCLPCRIRLVIERTAKIP